MKHLIEVVAFWVCAWTGLVALVAASVWATLEAFWRVTRSVEGIDLILRAQRLKGKEKVEAAVRVNNAKSST
jgi:hypothetical protein